MSSASSPPVPAAAGRGPALVVGAAAAAGVLAGARALWLARTARRFAAVRGDRFGRPVGDHGIEGGR